MGKAYLGHRTIGLPAQVDVLGKIHARDAATICTGAI